MMKRENAVRKRKQFACSRIAGIEGQCSRLDRPNLWRITYIVRNGAKAVAWLVTGGVGYLSAKPYPLKRNDVIDAKARNAGQTPRVMLRSDREAGIIELDSETQLSGTPEKAWQCKLGNPSVDNLAVILLAKLASARRYRR
jgi:hypothetical protein